MKKLMQLNAPKQANDYKQEIVNHPLELQDNLLKNLIQTAKRTVFGQDHNFNLIRNYDDFKNSVPVRCYNDFFKYWDLILQRKSNILWPGLPDFLIASSASTGTQKILPATEQFLKNFTTSIDTVIYQYIYDTKDFGLLDGKFMNFTGSSTLKDYCGYQIGAISGIVRNIMPLHLIPDTLPSKKALDLMDTAGWDAMFEQAAIEAMEKNVTFCSGLPSWMMQFFNSCLKITNKKTLKYILPNLRLLLTSGVNYKPYLFQFNNLFDNAIAIREIYAASEGVFAYQDTSQDNGLLLNISKGIYYEFIELSQFTSYLESGLEANNTSINFNLNHSRINLTDIKVSVPYVMIVNTCAGLWSYQVGDIIEFTSTNPFRIRVLGRTNHFISIQTEHVYAQHVEAALKEVNDRLKIEITNFTIAPNDFNDKTMPHHIWYIETPDYHGINLISLAEKLDSALQITSSGYEKGRKRNSLGKAQVVLLKNGAFLKYLATKNSSSLQLKVPKVSNDRSIAEFLINNNLVIN